MIPTLVLLFGLSVIGLCVWALSKSGRAYLRRKFRDAAEKDARTFGDSDRVG